jgi:MFS family permease
VGRNDLPGAISLHSANMNGSRVIGPVIGALLDSAFGAPAVFTVNGLSFLFVIGALLSVRLPPPTPSPGDARGLRRLMSGFAIARRDPVVGRCLVTIFTFSVLSLTLVGQFPVVAERNLGIDERSTSYGLLYACFGMVTQSLAPLVTQVSQDLGLTYTQVGSTLGAWQLVYIGVAAFAGTTMDRIGR